MGEIDTYSQLAIGSQQGPSPGKVDSQGVFDWFSGAQLTYLTQ
jgi:hypothetical protein